MIKLSGLTPAVFTPFDKTGAINLAQIQPYADKLVTDGADGVFVCGSTGECTSMTIAERKSVLEAWVNATSGRMRVIAHVGGTCQADCIELARHAAGLGVDAVGAIAPFYFKPASVGELVAFYKPIAAAIAPIPFYSYHMPSVTGINLPMKEFLEKGSREIPNLNGIKFTSNNFMEMLECIRLEDGRFDILNGFDEMLLCGMAVGARGGVGSTYNYSLPTYRNLYDAFLAGDIERARSFQQESADIVQHHPPGGGVRGGKAIMNHLGIDCGDCRLPFAPYTESEMRQLSEELDRIGFAK
ncbi:MAG: dihydrodipicolinate synthase family protein [Alistipes onderdonkii]